MKFSDRLSSLSKIAVETTDPLQRQAIEQAADMIRILLERVLLLESRLRNVEGFLGRESEFFAEPYVLLTDPESVS